MNCPKCRTENLTDSLFCEECSAPLEAACPACGAGNRPSAKFCRKCRAPLQVSGAGSQVSVPDTRHLTPAPRSYTPKHLADKILQSKSALEGERKQVTVLFADVKGSMELAEQLDPEEWHRILDRFFAILTDGVHRFEGTVNQYTGDGIMALFGAPIAHEDHAQRACYAALHLRDELARYVTEVKRHHGLTFSTRMGLHTGDVVVGKIGDDLRMDYTAQGHTVGLAQRMEGLASPDTCFLTGTTAALVANYCELEDLGDFTVKGVSTPVRVHRLVGMGTARTRFDVSRARGLTRFVGRDPDMATLENALGQAQAGRGQMIGIMAEAGTGKSRLCFEFTQRCRERGVTIYETHCLAHGRATPLAPMLELYRNVFGIEAGEPARTTRDKIAGRIALLDRSLLDALPLLFDFLGVPDPDAPAAPIDPDLRQRRLLGILQRITQARSPREAIVALIEDLHWVDPASEVFLTKLVDLVPAGRVLLLVNMRPEYRAPWMQQSYYRQIPLAPLGAAAIEELLGDLLGPDASLLPLRARIRERTAGNPFFVEEIVRELAARGYVAGGRGAYRLSAPIEQVPIPATVRGVLAARIDRLQPEAKATLQAAAAIGRTFRVDLLGTVTGMPAADVDATLAQLAADEFVYVEALYPHAEHSFKHALTRDVAYDSMLSGRKKGLHAALARALAAREGDGSGEHAALIAHHYDEAGEALEAARWHDRAALWVGLANGHESFEHCQRVRTLLKHVPETAETLALGLQACCRAVAMGLRAGVPDLDVAPLLADAKHWAARSGDATAELAVLTTEGNASWLMGDPTRAFASLDEALNRARAAGSRQAVAAVLPFWVLSYLLRDPARLLVVLDESGDVDLGATAATLGYSPHGLFAAFRVHALAFVGRCAEALVGLDRAIERAHAGGDRIDRAMTTAVLAMPATVMGHSARALALAREAVGLAEETGARLCIVSAYAQLLIALVDASGPREPAELDLVIRKVEEVAFPHYRSAVPLGRAALHISHGDVEQALDELRLAREQTRSAGLNLFSGWALLQEADLLVANRGASARPDVERVLESARLEIELASARVLLPRVNLIRARLLCALGDEAGRQLELRTARAAYVEMGAEKLVEAVDAQLEASARKSPPCSLT